MRQREGERVCVCVCDRERERERVCVCVTEREGERESMCVCVCVCARVHWRTFCFFASGASNHNCHPLTEIMHSIITPITAHI